MGDEQRPDLRERATQRRTDDLGFVLESERRRSDDVGEEDRDELRLLRHAARSTSGAYAAALGARLRSRAAGLELTLQGGELLLDRLGHIDLRKLAFHGIAARQARRF